MRPLIRFVQHFPLLAAVAAMIVWAIHFLLVYAGVGLACARGYSTTAVLLWLATTTVLALLVALAITLAGFDRARRPETPPHGQRRRFLARLSALLGGLALIAIVLTALPMLLVPPCR